MRSRALRVALTLLTAGVLVAAAYLFWNNERRSNRIAAEARVLNTRVSTAVRQAFDLRGAQRAYVSEGQSADYWITKVAASITALRESLTTLREASTSGSSRIALDGALEALRGFEIMDRRARGYAVSDQKLLASDLIFADGLEKTEEIITALEQTRYLETEEAAAAASVARRDQELWASLAALTALMAVILLAPLPTSRLEPAAQATSQMPATEPIEEFEFRPAKLPPAQVTGEVEPVVETAAPQPVQTVEVAAAPEEARPSAASLPDLEAVAAVCTELARLSDTTSLPSILERTASALDASGVMLWVADPEGRELTAISAHGYPATMLSRIGAIKRDAENVTAAAFRTGLLQIVEADEQSPGAIAAPLVNPSGCMGVMSAEVLHDGEKEPARLAVATIVAAQLATLMAPVTRTQAKSEAV